jgi:hypothetical protein
VVGGADTVVTDASGGNLNSEAGGDVENLVISKLVESEATLTYPSRPWAVEQIVLVPGTPDALRSTQDMANPFTVMLDDVTLSPANPAAMEKSRRNVTQWAGV